MMHDAVADSLGFNERAAPIYMAKPSTKHLTESQQCHFEVSILSTFYKCEN